MCRQCILQPGRHMCLIGFVRAGPRNHGQTTQHHCCGRPFSVYTHAAKQVLAPVTLTPSACPLTLVNDPSGSMRMACILTVLAVLHRSPEAQGHVLFENKFCWSCAVDGVDLRMPAAFTVSLYGSPICNAHSIALVSAAPLVPTVL